MSDWKEFQVGDRVVSEGGDLIMTVVRVDDKIYYPPKEFPDLIIPCAHSNWSGVRWYKPGELMRVSI